MRNPKEEKKDDLVEMCQELEFSPEEQEAALAFMAGKAGEEALEKIHFRDLTQKTSAALVRLGYELAQKEKTDQIKNLFLILFAAGQSTCYKLLEKTYIRRKQLSDVDLIRLASVYSAQVGFSAYSVRAYTLVELIELLDEKPETIRQILNYDKNELPNGKIALFAAYFQKKYACDKQPKAVKEEDCRLLEEYEAALTECLSRFYEGRVEPEAIKELEGCISNGGLPQQLSSLTGRQFRLAAAAAYLNYPLSEKMENIVKICINSNWKESLEAMHSISIGFPIALNKVGGDFPQVFGIDSADYISWALSKNMKYILEEQAVNSTDAYLRVLSGAEIGDALSMLWFIKKGNPALHEEMVEEKRRSGEFREKVIEKLLRKDPDAAVTAGYLRGENTVESMYPYFEKRAGNRCYDGGREYALLENFDCNFCDREFYRRCEVYMISRQAATFFRNRVSTWDGKESRVDKERVKELLGDLAAEGTALSAQMLVVGILHEALQYAQGKEDFLAGVMEYFSICLKERRQDTLAAFAGADAYVRLAGVKLLCQEPEENKEELFKYTQDGAEIVKEELAGFLRAKKDWEEDVKGLLASKKAAQREFAVRLLAFWQKEGADYRELFAGAMEKEKSAKVRELLGNVLGADDEGVSSVQVVSRADLVKNLHKGGRKRSLAWAYETPFPKVHMALLAEEKKEAAEADEEYLQAVLLCYAAAEECGTSKNAQLLAEALNLEEFSIYVNELFERWLAAGAESKKRWVLYAAAIHGGSTIVEKLKQQIKEWPKQARGAIACEAVKALSLNPLPQALLTVDAIARKFKYKQVRAAAEKALEFAAEQLGISREELADRIVPDFGFDENMERCFDYGERAFLVTITPALEVEVYEAAPKKEGADEEGKAARIEAKEQSKKSRSVRAKKLKSLPAPGKKDDEEKAKAAYEEFKQLKKQLKVTVASQKDRLEMALSTFREWSADAWRRLFVKNPVMHLFATGLIWGVYEKGKRINSFRYMEDGSFNTQEGEEYELSENAKIGLVHPVELTKEERKAWIEQMEDYEIVQPFEQLKRAVYTVTEEEAGQKRLARFAERTVNDLSLGSRLGGLGWYRGSVQDGGGFYTYYREDAQLGLGVELHFSGSYVGGSNEDVTIYDARFYKAGTVSRGSYVYDEAGDDKAYFLKDIPVRYFSEVVWQLEKATAQ